MGGTDTATGQADVERNDSSYGYSCWSAAAHRWNETIDGRHTDLICLGLSLITGLCDSSAYNAWSCFLAMQTGW